VRSLALVAAVALGGCPPAPHPRDVMQCGRAATAVLAPCPTERALATHLRDRWSLPASAAITTTCTPGRFGGAGWLIRATVERGERSSAATFVLQQSCGALTDAMLRDEPPGDDAHETIDLDGDGLDEVLVRRSAVEDGGASTSLVVLRVGGGRLVRSGKVRIAFDGVDAAVPSAGTIRCDGKVSYLVRPEGGFYLEIDSVDEAQSTWTGRAEPGPFRPSRAVSVGRT
jgi:hypothetical protein